MAQIGIQFTKEPTNVTVVEHDNVYVPCCTNTTFLPTWRINGEEYASDVGLPTHFILNATHLIIPDIALFLNGTVVQCFFVRFLPAYGLLKTYSSIGIINVVTNITAIANTAISVNSTTPTTLTLTDFITSTSKFTSLGKGKLM